METTIDRLNLFNKMFSLVYHDMFVHGFSLFYIVAATTAIYDVCWQNEIFPQQRSENLLDRQALLARLGWRLLLYPNSLCAKVLKAILL